MKIIVIILLLIIILYLTFKPVAPRDDTVTIKAAILPKYSNIPPTWNFDWQGGPGKDRFDIMAEKGPYNPDGRIVSVVM